MANGDYAAVREIMTRINRLGNEIKKIQKNEKKRDLERHCQSLNNETNPKKFFKTFGIVAKPILNEVSHQINRFTQHPTVPTPPLLGLAVTDQRVPAAAAGRRTTTLAGHEFGGGGLEGDWPSCQNWFSCTYSVFTELYL